MTHAVYPSLASKTVVITGGGSGIGAVMVEGFSRQKARVFFLDVADEASKALVARLGNGVQFINTDVTDIEALRAAVSSIEAKAGAISVLVNNAANDDRHKFEEVTPAYWEQRIAVNLRHIFFGAQFVTAGMRKAGGGSIINLGSTSWKIGLGGMAAYTASKSGVTGLTRSLARDLGPDNIRVNTISPGWIMTERQLRLWVTPEGEKEIMKNQCLKRKLHPVDVARVALFLASDESSACTNQDFTVDGGWI